MKKKSARVSMLGQTIRALFCLFGCVSGATHWVVTDEGRIQAAGDSLFNMAKSHDLVQFMKQEERVRHAMVAQTDIDDKKFTIKRHEDKDDPKIEQKLMVNDPDCQRAGKPLPQHNLYTSSAITLDSYGFHIDTFIGKPRPIPKSTPLLEPFCTKYYKLAFSMAAFEHLDAVRLRANLTSTAENGLGSFLHPGWENSSDFGYFITLALKETPTSWVLHNLASFYWRIVGNAYEAIECVRRSLHLTPRRYIAVPMLNLANVLHQSGYSSDAGIVLDVLINFNDSIAAGYCAAAEVYAVISQFNASTAAFEACLLLDPDYPKAARHLAAVRCHQKLEGALESQHDNLQQTLHELQSYQKRLKGYQMLHEKMLAQLIDPQGKEQQALLYDYFTYGTIEHAKCQWHIEQGKSSLKCSVDDWEGYRRSRSKKHKQLFGKMRSETPEFSFRDMKAGEEVDMLAKDCPEEVAEETFKWPTAPPDADRAHADALQMHKGLVINPTHQTKYPLRDRSHLSTKHFIFKDADWPSKQECAALSLPTGVDSLPSLFISPEHKGFAVTDLVTKFLGLGGPEHPHPFPWYPPFCAFPYEKVVNLACCDHLLGVQRAKKRDQTLMIENELRPMLLNLSGRPLDSEAEAGQRITSLINNDNGPKWLVYNLAALYWRVAGLASETIACLRQALADENAPHQDIALIQLAQMSATAGQRTDDAIVLVKHALEVEHQEPTSHFLLAHLLVRNKNYTGALHHVNLALELDPLFPGALLLAKQLRCYSKYAKAEIVLEKPPLKCNEKTVPKFFCLKDLGGKERCYMEEKALPGERGGCKSDNNCLHCAPSQLPECVPPPAWASLILPTLEKQQNEANLERLCRSAEPVCQLVDSNCGQPIEFVETERPKPPAEVKPPSARPTIEHREKPAKTHDEEGGEREPETINVRLDNDEEEIEEVTLDADNLDQVSLNSANRPPPSKTVVQYGIPKTAGASPPVIRKPPAQRPEKDSSHMTIQLASPGKSAKVEVLDNKVPKSNMATITLKAPNDGRSITVFLDTPLPEVLPEPFGAQVKTGAQFVHALPTSSAECAQLKKRINLEQATSTWLSVTAKGLKLDTFLDINTPVPKETKLEPVCPDLESNSMWTMDHLYGYIERKHLDTYKPEKGLKDAFESLGSRKEPFEQMATRLTLAMRNVKNKENGEVHWSLSTVAALYWRVKGDAANAIKCLRHSLNHAPYHMRDLALVSLANVYHQAGMLHSALIVGGSALQLSPRFVVIHFTLANIYSALGDLDRAMQFYYSTLALQNNFEPARDRIKTIYCITAKVPHQVAEAAAKSSD